jgi:hypothetical protein
MTAGILITLLAALGLTGTATAAKADPLSCGAFRSAFVFNRPNSAFQQGHVGWGYRVTCTGTFYFGAIEGNNNQPIIPAGQNNGFWWQSGTESQMMNAMRERSYTAYKTLNSAGNLFDPDPATQFASGSAARGYNVVGNNCADNTWDVLNAYGVPDLPLLQIHAAPNEWYDFLRDTSNVNWTNSTAL